MRPIRHRPSWRTRFPGWSNGEHGENGHTRGQALVEFAMVLPVFFLVGGATAVEAAVLLGQRPGIRFPALLHGRRLDVVMRVEQKRPGGARGFQFGVDDWVTGGLEQFGSETAALEHRAQVSCVAADARTVGGNVWNREQVHQLGDDLLAFGDDPAANVGLRRRRCHRCSREHCGKRERAAPSDSKPGQPAGRRHDLES